MTWRELYEGLQLLPVRFQPIDGDIKDHLERLALGEPFALRPFRAIEDERGNVVGLRSLCDFVFVRVQQFITTDSDAHRFVAVCSTIGTLPRGFQHGTFRIVFDEGGMCMNIPPKMLEDGEISREALTGWRASRRRRRAARR